MAKSRSDGKLYVITAGHCLYDTGTWSTRLYGGTLRAIGTVWKKYDNSTRDFGSILVSDPGYWRPEATVVVLTSSNSAADTVRDEHYDVPATGANTPGNIVCSTAGRSGWTFCGILLNTGASYAGMTNLARVDGESALCGQDGDSGSPVYKSHLARGIYIADEPGCAHWYYQGINDILSTLNLTLALTG